MGDGGNSILNTYGAITRGDDGEIYTLGLTAGEEISEDDDDMREFVLNQLALLTPDAGGQRKVCYIKDAFDNGVLLCGRDTSEHLMKVDDDKWVALYRDGEPAMVKRNIFGRVKKNFW